jgi:hypothetical protein
VTEFRKTALLLFGVFLAALIGCAIGCSIAIGLMVHQAEPVEHVDGHDWLHDQLAITEEQNTALIPIEEKFATQEEELRAAIIAGNAELGRILREDREFSPRAAEIVDEIHKAQAKLQKATIDHVIEMKTVLSPEQFDQLLELAGESLEDH